MQTSLVSDMLNQIAAAVDMLRPTIARKEWEDQTGKLCLVKTMLEEIITKIGASYA